MIDERHEMFCQRLIDALMSWNCKCNWNLIECLPVIVEAEADLCNYLHVSRPLDEEYEHKIVELAKIRVMKANASELKSYTYTEGSVSKSEAYMTASDFEAQEKAVFESLNTQRRCRIVKS